MNYLPKEIANICLKLEDRQISLCNSINSIKLEIKSSKRKIENLIKARWILTEVQKQTQLRFKAVVEDLVTLAIESVYKRDLKFELVFEEKRNKFECRPVIREGDRIYENPEDDLGGGILDIISFAFRIVLWYLADDRKRNVMMLDEPMKFVGQNLIHLAGQVIWEISHKLNIQIILVTHDRELIEIGETCYHVDFEGGKSKVQKINSTDNLVVKKVMYKRLKII